MPVLVYTRYPQRLTARHPLIIETLLDMNWVGRGEAVAECVRMCRDL